MKKMSLMIVLFAIALLAIPCMADGPTFVVTPNSGSEPLVIQLDASGLEPLTSYTVYWDDGNSKSIPADEYGEFTATHPYDTYGKYNIDVVASVSVGGAVVIVVPSVPAKNDDVVVDVNGAWNAFSTPLPLLDPRCPVVMSGYVGDGEVQVVLGWEDNKWVDKSGWGVNVEPLDGYYVYVSEPGTITLKPDYQYGDVADKDVPTGFSLVGYVPYYDGVLLDDDPEQDYVDTFEKIDVIGLGAVIRGSPFTNIEGTFTGDAENRYTVGDAYWAYNGGELTTIEMGYIPKPE